ncbi:hypothetical protein V2J09_009414 [Rumex salicifolius]
MDTHLETVKLLLDAFTLESIDLCCVVITSFTKSAAILEEVVSLIYDKAVLDPTNSPLYAKLCSKLNEKLPSFLPTNPNGKEITFKRLLLNTCQEAFECRTKARLNKLHTLGNIQFIGELFKQKVVLEKIVHLIVQVLLGADNMVCPEEENVEAICHFFITIGKQLDESPMSRPLNNLYFNRLKELTENPQLAPHMTFMVRNLIDLRTDKWVPRRQEAVEATQNVELENKELSQAIQRNSSSRTFLILFLFLLVLTFSILFLDWYS